MCGGLSAGLRHTASAMKGKGHPRPETILELHVLQELEKGEGGFVCRTAAGGAAGRPAGGVRGLWPPSSQAERVHERRETERETSGKGREKKLPKLHTTRGGRYGVRSGSRRQRGPMLHARTRRAGRERGAAKG